MKWVLVGDGESPHLLKWAKVLAPRVELYVVSSTAFLPEYDLYVAHDRRLLLPLRAGRRFTGFARSWLLLRYWLLHVRPDVVNPHYLSSHGVLARSLMSRAGAGRFALVGSAWGTDILVTPQQSAMWRWLTAAVLKACTLSTSDSQYMAQQMRALGAREVVTFPFGLEALPDFDAHSKDPDLFFANRGLDEIYAPLRVVDQFRALAEARPHAKLVVARTGPALEAMKARLAEYGLAHRAEFVGFLDAAAQAAFYAKALWYISLPRSDSVSVSVIEAMSHGCIPILSDLPANRELIRSGETGLIVPDGQLAGAADIGLLAPRSSAIAKANREWVKEHALFGPSVDDLIERMAQVLAGDRGLK